MTSTDPANHQSDYDFSKDYWANIDASIDGVLGGHGHLHSLDISSNDSFLKRMLSKHAPQFTSKTNDSQRSEDTDYALREKTLSAEIHTHCNDRSVLDCGAGIGRISTSLLSRHFDIIDLLEQNANFLQCARQHASEPSNPLHGKLQKTICKGLQDFSASKEQVVGRYSVIWIQWVLLYLFDDDLIAFLRQCVEALQTETGAPRLIFVKENILKASRSASASHRYMASKGASSASVKTEEFDDTDHSLTRSDQAYKRLFAMADLELLGEQEQIGFDSSLLPVRMYCLRPKNVASNTGPSK